MTEWQRSFLHTRTGKSSLSLREMCMECSDEERQLSVEFYDRYPAGRSTGFFTPFAGILQGPGPLAGGEDLVRAHRANELVSQAAEEPDLDARLTRRVPLKYH
jgi:hypothetical protein